MVWVVVGGSGGGSGSGSNGSCIKWHNQRTIWQHVPNVVSCTADHCISRTKGTFRHILSDHRRLRSG